MKKFRKIKIVPQTDLNSLGLNIENTQQFDLTDLPKEEMDRRLTAAWDVIKKNKGSIAAVATSTSGQTSAITSVLNSSKHRSQIILLQEPNPILIYYSIANEHLEKAYPIRNSIVTMSHVDNYAGLVTEYLKEVTQGIVFLVMTLEALFNQRILQIPDGFILDAATGNPLPKSRLEWLDFTTKLKSLMPIATGSDYSKQHPDKYNDLIILNGLRNDLTHLKPSLKKNFTLYEDLNKRLIDFDPHRYSEAVWHYVNTLEPNFFTEQTE